MSPAQRDKSIVRTKKAGYNAWLMTLAEVRDMSAAVAELDLSDRDSEYLRAAKGASTEVAVNCVLLYIGRRMWEACSGARTSREQKGMQAAFMKEIIDDVEQNYILLEEKIEREKLSDTP